MKCQVRKRVCFVMVGANSCFYFRCKKKTCPVYMHFPCGQKVGATFQFMGKMHTYCYMHRVKQKEENFPSPPDIDCVICYEKVDTKV